MDRIPEPPLLRTYYKTNYLDHPGLFNSFWTISVALYYLSLNSKLPQILYHFLSFQRERINVEIDWENGIRKL